MGNTILIIFGIIVIVGIVIWAFSSVGIREPFRSIAIVGAALILILVVLALIGVVHL